MEKTLMRSEQYIVILDRSLCGEDTWTGVEMLPVASAA